MKEARAWGPLLFIAASSSLVALALAIRGNSCGHDFDFHLLSWMEAARSWHSGVLYPHWVRDANYGAGEPRLVFYPPGSWILGALLGTLTSWSAAPGLFVLLCLAGCGWSMYFLAREWIPRDEATLAACLYIANPYAMFVVFERSAFGELLAGAFVPMVVLFALRKTRSIAALGLAIAAVWFSNVPAGIITCYLLAFLAAAMVIQEKQAWPALRAAAGLALGLGAAAFYIVPSVYEQHWIQVAQAIAPGMRVEDSFLFEHTTDLFHEQVLRTASWIVVAEIAVAALAAYFASRRSAGGKARFPLTCLLPVILFLQLPISEAIWSHAPYLKYLQFPWRWLLVLSVAACALAGMALADREGGRRWRFAGGAILVLAMVVAGARLFFQACDDEDAVAAQIAQFETGLGVPGTDEYTPADADNSAVQQELPWVRLLRGPQDDSADPKTENPEWRSKTAGILPAEIKIKTWNTEHWTAWIESDGARYAVLRLMDYPAWRVTVNGKPALHRPRRDDGLIVVPLAMGGNAIDVRWIVTGDVRIGLALSAISLLALAGVAVLEAGRFRKPQV